MIFDFYFTTSIRSQNHLFQLNVSCQSAAKRLLMMGASGSGKSLTVHLLAGLRKPDSGSLNIQNTLYVDTSKGIHYPPQKREVGVMFQDYALFPHLTVAQNIAFGRCTGWHNPKQTIDTETEKWLNRMQLCHVAHHYPHQISGGQKQRVALARACAVTPRWLLLDEPFSALDKGLRQEMRLELLDLQKELDIPMLLISHDDDDALILAEEVWTMDRGVLFPPKSSSTLFRQP